MPEFKPGARLSKKPPLNEQELIRSTPTGAPPIT